MDRDEEDLVQETRDELDRAERADPAERTETLEELNRSLESEIEKPESEDPG